MGLNKGGNKKSRYSVKRGVITKWGGDETGTSFTGILKGMYVRPNEFEGRNTDLLNLLLEDTESGEQSWLDFNLESYAGQSFVRSAVNLDLKREFTLSAMPQEGNDKITYINLFQDSEMVKWGDHVPVKKTVNVGKQKVTDWTEFRAFADKWIAETNEQLGFGKKNDAEVTDVPTEDENIPF